MGVQERKIRQAGKYLHFSVAPQILKAKEKMQRKNRKPDTKNCFLYLRFKLTMEEVHNDGLVPKDMVFPGLLGHLRVCPARTVLQLHVGLKVKFS